MTPRVFISYRQTSDVERARVRAFGEKLRGCGIEVVLDQFHLEQQPEGPHDRWDKWSSDCALHTERVIIIGSESWFLCFDKKQPPGTGLGAACEADDIRHRLYEAGGLNGSIRVVLFDEADSVHISVKLKRYHRFHAEHDFHDIVKWLGGALPPTRDAGTGANTTVPSATSADMAPLSTPIPHNLPSLQPFFGREEELKRIAGALDPKHRGWGTLIGGDGGRGKTSLAVRAAYEVPPEHFERIVFVSIKQRQQDDHRVRALSGFSFSSWMEMLGEIARCLELPAVTQAPEERRARTLSELLEGRRILLVLDNLETLSEPEQDQLFAFLDHLPAGCKALLTSREYFGNTVHALELPALDQSTALELLGEIAQHNAAFARSTEAERILLVKETHGNALLLRWTAGQVGRGACTSIADALRHLRSCPKGNNVLEFVFGDVVDSLVAEDLALLAALTHPTQPARVADIIAVSGVSAHETPDRLKLLRNRSLVTSGESLEDFVLVPTVAAFLRQKRPDIVAETGARLETHVHALVEENGHRKHERFPALNAAWPMVAAALPRFIAGPNDRLQAVCRALRKFLDFSGRWDECITLSRDAGKKAADAGDFIEAGWRAYEAGWIHCLRGQAAEVLSLAGMAAGHWERAGAGALERSCAIRLRGEGHQIAEDYVAAVEDYREAVDLSRSVDSTGREVVMSLNALANARWLSGDLDAAERDYREALRIAREGHDTESVATCTANLAQLALEREDWPAAEALVREALPLCEALGRQELIGGGCVRLAQALLRQVRHAEALPHARRAHEIFSNLGHPDVPWARDLLAECEALGRR